MKKWMLIAKLLLTLSVVAQAEDYTYITNSDNTITITGYTGTTSVLTIPDTIGGQVVASIGEQAFYNRFGMTSITIPSSVTNIGSSAFSYCYGLTGVTIPASVNGIGSTAFRGCTKLSAITVETNNAFYSSLDGVLFNKSQTMLIQYPANKAGGSYTIPASCTKIENYAFWGCTNLTSVATGNSVTDIGYDAFYTCSSLTNIIIGSSVTNIEPRAFEHCTSLPSVTIPDNVTSLRDNAFYNCTNLTNAVIGSGVTSIGDEVFKSCIALRAITVDEANPSYSSLDGVLFDKNQTLLIQYTLGRANSYAVPASVTHIGSGAFQWCAGLTSITMPTNVSSIGGLAFFGCTSLTNFTIPDAVTSLSFAIFYNCTRLPRITIPDRITYIGDFTFYGCGSLSAVYFKGDAPTLGSDVFFDATNATVYRLSGAAGWPTVPDPFGNKPTALWSLTYLLAVNGGTGDGSYTNGSQVQIEADAPTLGQAFDRWIGDTQYVASVTSATTTVTMPAQEVSLTATYKNVYALRVTGGTGSGSYTNGSRVTITADVRSGQVFDRWTGSTQYVAGVTSSTAIVTMPAQAISLTATYVADTTKPTVAITSPTAALRISNSLYTVKGTAADNKVVTNVLVKLNNGEYLPAVTTNGWKNWSALVQLVAGSNTVRAYSVDSAVNNSLTSSVSCTYVVPGTLIVRTNGLGTVSRAPATVPEVGATYTLTATPGTGFGFANWTGDATSTNKVLSFTMTTNKTVTANFVDIAKPTVAITLPTAALRIFSNAVYTVKGTATDNGVMTGVFCRVNSGTWTLASTTNLTTNVWKSWSIPVTLTAGSNLVQVYGMDKAGNVSATSSVSCTYVVPVSLTVTTNGVGTVTRAPATPPEVGVKYTLTAAAGTGSVFSNWTGDVTSTNKVLTVIPTNSMTFTANFTDIQKPTVAITSPTAAQRVLGTNGSFMVRGTAADNGTLSNIMVQVNSGSWTNAETTNVLKNWSLPVMLIPGITNTIAAYSVDTTGNCSLTVTTKCVYVETGTLIINTNGPGAVAIAPAGALELGKTYTLTATAGTGGVFSNWSGDAVGNPTGKVVTVKLDFTNRTKTVTVNFIDTAKPTVAITAPTAALRVLGTNGLFTVRGTATDNGQLSGVKVQLNGDWTDAVTTNNWKNWSAEVLLALGTNTIRAYSTDTGGNNSSTSSVVCTYVMTVPTFTYNGHIYKLVTADKATWTAAKAAAAASVLNGMTGHLAVIETPEENAAIFEALNPASNSFINTTMPRAAYTHPDSGARGIWIGASDSAASVPGASEGNFFWIGRGMIAAQNFWTGGQRGSAVPGNFANWGLGLSVGEPDNWSGRQHAVAMQLDGWLFGAAGQWNDLDGNQPQAYLIEYDRDEVDIRAFYTEMKRAHEKHDLDALSKLFSSDYYVHEGRLFSDWYSDPSFIESFKTFAFNITRITIFGNNAKVSGSVSAVFNNGASALVPEPDMANNSPGFGHLWRTTNGWQVVGDQKFAMTSLITIHQANPGNEQYALWMRTKSSIAISSVSVSGPGLPETALVQDPYSGEFTVESPALSTNPVPAVGSTYSFLIQFADGFQETYQDTIKSWVPKAPAITLTGGAGSVTVHWNNISGSVPGADHYLVRVLGDSANWAMDYLPLSRTSAVFNEDGRAQGSLIGGQNYYAQIFIFNKNGDYAHQWVSFTMPSTAPQMSAGSDSLVLSGASDLISSGTVEISASVGLTNTITLSSLALKPRQAAITVDGAVEDWVNVPRASFSYPVAGTSITQKAAVALDGKNIALLLSGCPFSTSDTVLVYFKLRLNYGDAANTDLSHTVDLWTSGSVLYGMVDGKKITGLEKVLSNGVMEVKFPSPEGQVPAQIKIEEIGCGKDPGDGTLTELFKRKFLW